MAERAQRAAELLRTRVDVERSAQNQKLLESMDKRADLQLRLQRTVEGLWWRSAITVNLATYMAAIRLRKGMATAMATPLVVLLVWLAMRRIRKHMD
jgi:uncharacterized membrane-anchored protein